MTARLELFLLCGVLPVAVVLLLGAWQDGRRAHRRLAAQARPALLPERKIPVDK